MEGPSDGEIAALRLRLRNPASSLVDLAFYRKELPALLDKIEALRAAKALELDPSRFVPKAELDEMRKQRDVAYREGWRGCAARLLRQDDKGLKLETLPEVIRLRAENV